MFQVLQPTIEKFATPRLWRFVEPAYNWSSDPPLLRSCDPLQPREIALYSTYQIPLLESSNPQHVGETDVCGTFAPSSLLHNLNRASFLRQRLPLRSKRKDFQLKLWIVLNTIGSIYIFLRVCQGFFSYRLVTLWWLASWIWSSTFGLLGMD